MALWRVLDIYKRVASRRGQAPAEKPSERGRKRKVQSRADGGVRANPLANRAPYSAIGSLNLCSLFLIPAFVIRISFGVDCIDL